MCHVSVISNCSVNPGAYCIFVDVQLCSDHAAEIEQLWAALVTCWPGNLAVIMRYIVIVVGMYPHALLAGVSNISFIIHASKCRQLIVQV